MTEKKLIEIMDRERIRQRKSKRSVSINAGLSENVYSHWIRGLCSPCLYTFEAALNELGLELRIARRPK